MSNTTEYKLTEEQRELLLNTREYIVELFREADNIEHQVLAYLDVKEDSLAHGWLVDIFYNSYNDSTLENVEQLLGRFEKAVNEEIQNGNV
jgi:hypothetical protein